MNEPTTMIELSAQGLKGAKKILTDIKDREIMDNRVAYKEYFARSKEYVSFCKTILFGQVPQRLDTFFEPIQIKVGGEEIDTSNINNIFNYGKKIIITGSGGSGKSILMKHFFLNTLECTEYVPVLIELRGFNENTKQKNSIEECVYKSLENFGLELTEASFEYSLKKGYYLVLLDGFDEVKGEYSENVTSKIINFSKRYPEIPVVISSRPLEEFIGWENFVEYSTKSLNILQALSLIDRLEYDNEVKEQFRGALKDYLYYKYNTFASNPLLLNIMLMTFEESSSIPENKIDFYEQAFATLFHKHDASKKGCFRREKRSGLNYEEFKKMFSYFCFQSFFHNQFEFRREDVLNICINAKQKAGIMKNFEVEDFFEDLTKAVCMLLPEGQYYRFCHRSFQEYFASIYISQLDDEKQKKFLNAWIKEEKGRQSSDILSILSAIQPKRYIKNVLCEILGELYEKYEKEDKSDDWYLEYMFGNIILKENDKKTTCSSIIIKNRLYFSMLREMKKLLNYKRPSYGDNEDLARKLKEKYGRNTISFAELRIDGLYEEVIEAFGWIFEDLNMIPKMLEEYMLPVFQENQKIEFMLDDM